MSLTFMYSQRSQPCTVLLLQQAIFLHCAVSFFDPQTSERWVTLGSHTLEWDCISMKYKDSFVAVSNYTFVVSWALETIFFSSCHEPKFKAVFFFWHDCRTRARWKSHRPLCTDEESFPESVHASHPAGRLLWYCETKSFCMHVYCSRDWTLKAEF